MEPRHLAERAVDELHSLNQQRKRWLTFADLFKNTYARPWRSGGSSPAHWLHPAVVLHQLSSDGTNPVSTKSTRRMTKSDTLSKPCRSSTHNQRRWLFATQGCTYAVSNRLVISPSIGRLPSKVVPRTRKLLRTFGNDRKLRSARSTMTHPPRIPIHTFSAPPTIASYPRSMPVSPAPRTKTFLPLSCSGEWYSLE